MSAIDEFGKALRDVMVGIVSSECRRSAMFRSEKICGAVVESWVFLIRDPS